MPSLEELRKQILKEQEESKRIQEEKIIPDSQQKKNYCWRKSFGFKTRIETNSS